MVKTYTENEPLELNWRDNDLKFVCCDCGLVHRLRFAVSGKRLRLRAKRDNRATGQIRRHLRISHEDPTAGVCAFLHDAIATGILDKRCHDTAQYAMQAAKRKQEKWKKSILLNSKEEFERNPIDPKAS